MQVDMGRRCELVTTQVVSQGVKSRISTRDWFYPSMAGLALVFSAVAFGPSILNPAGRQGPVSTLLAVHGAVFFLWLLLFLAQTLLVRTRNFSWHRRLGLASIVLSAAMVILGYTVTIAMGHRGYDLSGDISARTDPLAAMGAPLMDIGVFAILFGAAYLYRRRTEVHKRLMLLTVFGALMPSSVVHLIGHFVIFRGKEGLFIPLFIALFLAVGAVHDLVVSRRVHPVSVWLPLAWFGIQYFCAVVAFQSAAWHRFAAMLLG